MRIVEANQVPLGDKVSPNIFALPCVSAVHKSLSGHPVYKVNTGTVHLYAVSGFWICKFEDGTWDVLTEEEYNEKKTQQTKST